jgi:hypothetical protein
MFYEMGKPVKHPKEAAGWPRKKPVRETNRLIETLYAQLKVPSYAALARTVGMGPTKIYRLRYNLDQLTDQVLQKIHNATQIPIATLQDWAQPRDPD